MFLGNMIKGLVNSLDTAMRIPQNVAVQVRYRYFKDKPLFVRRWGYKDTCAWSGLLPRSNTGNRMPIPEFRPKNPWSEKKALFGQNDYIDILGDMKVHPVMISYSIPPWLRGFHGNEYQIALRKRALLGRKLHANAPFQYNNLKKVIRYQYNFLNKHTRQNRMPKEYKRYLAKN